MRSRIIRKIYILKVWFITKPRLKRGFVRSVNGSELVLGRPRKQDSYFSTYGTIFQSDTDYVRSGLAIHYGTIRCRGNYIPSTVGRISHNPPYRNLSHLLPSRRNRRNKHSVYPYISPFFPCFNVIVDVSKEPRSKLPPTPPRISSSHSS